MEFKKGMTLKVRKPFLAVDYILPKGLYVSVVEIKDNNLRLFCADVEEIFSISIKLANNNLELL